MKIKLSIFILTMLITVPFVGFLTTNVLGVNHLAELHEMTGVRFGWIWLIVVALWFVCGVIELLRTGRMIEVLKPIVAAVAVYTVAILAIGFVA